MVERSSWDIEDLVRRYASIFKFWCCSTRSTWDYAINERCSRNPYSIEKQFQKIYCLCRNVDYQFNHIV